MKKLLFVAFVSGIALAACKGGDKNADADKAKDSIAAKNHQDSLMNMAKMQHAKDSVAAMHKDSTKADSAKK